MEVLLRLNKDLLNNLLQEYEVKRRNALADLDFRKKALYESCPRLQEIENELNNYFKKLSDNNIKVMKKKYF